MTSYARGSNPSAEQRARDDRRMSMPTTGPGPQRIPKMPRPMPMEPMPMEPMEPMPRPPRSYGDDFRSMPISKEEYLRDRQIKDQLGAGGNTGPMGPIGRPVDYELMPMPERPRGPGSQKIMERPEPRRPRMPDEGGDRSDMMRRIMEMFGQGGDQRPPRRGPSRQDRRQNDLIYDMPRMPQRYEEFPQRYEEFPQRLTPQEIFTARSRGGPEYEAPMMMSNGGSAWRGSLPQGYEADEELRAQALADFDAGADIDGDRQISDEELYNWRPSDSRYGTNPNNRVNRDQSYSQAALDTLRRKGADMGDDGVFSEEEFWKFDAARQQNEGQNYGGATLEGEFNYQDPSTWNAPQPPMPERMPMPPSQTTYVPEPARNPYVFGGYGSPPPQYAGMADPRMTNIVGMAPPSYYGGAEEQLNGFSQLSKLYT